MMSRSHYCQKALTLIPRTGILSALRYSFKIRPRHGLTSEPVENIFSFQEIIYKLVHLLEIFECDIVFFIRTETLMFFAADMELM